MGPGTTEKQLTNAQHLHGQSSIPSEPLLLGPRPCRWPQHLPLLCTLQLRVPTAAGLVLRAESEAGATQPCSTPALAPAREE